MLWLCAMRWLEEKHGVSNSAVGQSFSVADTGRETSAVLAGGGGGSKLCFWCNQVLKPPGAKSASRFV